MTCVSDVALNYPTSIRPIVYLVKPP